MSISTEDRKRERETCPKGVRVVCIGKEVVGLGGPGEVEFVEGIKIAGGGGVEHFHLVTL